MTPATAAFYVVLSGDRVFRFQSPANYEATGTSRKLLRGTSEVARSLSLGLNTRRTFVRNGGGVVRMKSKRAKFWRGVG